MNFIALFVGYLSQVVEQAYDSSIVAQATSQLQRLFVERAGLCVVSPAVLDHAQIIQRAGSIPLIAKLAPGRKSLFKPRTCGRVVPLFARYQSQIVEHTRDAALINQF